MFRGACLTFSQESTVESSIAVGSQIGPYNLPSYPRGGPIAVQGVEAENFFFGIQPVEGPTKPQNLWKPLREDFQI